MSITLLDILEDAGYDVKNNLNDARWFLGQKDEFDSLYDEVTEFEESYSEYVDYILTEEDLGNFNNPTFEEWREEQ